MYVLFENVAFLFLVADMNCTTDGHLYMRVTIGLCRFLTLDRSQLGRHTITPRWCSMLPKSVVDICKIISNCIL